MKKSVKKSTPTTPAPLTPMALLASIAASQLVNTTELFEGAERALPTLVHADGGMLDAVIDACEALNLNVHGVDYADRLRSIKALENRKDEEVFAVRDWDTRAAFALGLAAGLRIGGAK